MVYASNPSKGQMRDRLILEAHYPASLVYFGIVLGHGRCCLRQEVEGGPPVTATPVSKILQTDYRIPRIIMDDLRSLPKHFLLGLYLA